MEGYEDSNIYYYFIKHKETLETIITEMIDNPVVSLYIIKFNMEILYDYFNDFLKTYNLYEKHKYIFVNINLPKLVKMYIELENEEDLVHLKESIFLTEMNYKYNNGIGNFIIVINDIFKKQ